MKRFALALTAVGAIALVTTPHLLRIRRTVASTTTLNTMPSIVSWIIGKLIVRQ